MALRLYTAPVGLKTSLGLRVPAWWGKREGNEKVTPLPRTTVGGTPAASPRQPRLQDLDSAGQGDYFGFRGSVPGEPGSGLAGAEPSAFSGVEAAGIGVPDP